MKIAICGLVKSSNLGEQFISKSLSWIISEELMENGFNKTVEFVEVDIQATNDEVVDYKNLVQSRIHNLYKYTYRGIPADYIHYKLKSVAEIIKSKKGKT